MFWVQVAIIAYLFSALATLIDKHLLGGAVPHPRVYTFYIGVLGALSLVLFPLGFFINDPVQLLLALLSGVLLLYGLFWFFKALSLFESSRVVPAIGGLTPLFVFGLTHLTGGRALRFDYILAFFLLIAGSFFITLNRADGVTQKSFKISLVAAFFFALSAYLAKIVYLNQPFWPAFIWMRIGGLIFVLFFLFSRGARKEIFLKRAEIKKGVFGLFFLGQSFGAISAFLQNWAIALVPVSFLSFVNALEGVKYLFLLVFTVLISLKFPEIMKEEFSPKAIFQKVFAIFLISTGLVLLAFNQ